MFNQAKGKSFYNDIFLNFVYIHVCKNSTMRDTADNLWIM